MCTKANRKQQQVVCKTAKICSNYFNSFCYKLSWGTVSPTRPFDCQAMIQISLCKCAGWLEIALLSKGSQTFKLYMDGQRICLECATQARSEHCLGAQAILQEMLYPGAIVIVNCLQTSHMKQPVMNKEELHQRNCLGTVSRKTSD